MVLGTYCIIFTRVVVIHFYPRSCNSIGLVSVCSAKSCKSTNTDLTLRIKDMKLKTNGS